MNRLFVISWLLTMNGLLVNAQSFPLVNDIEFQPLAAQVERVAQTLDILGAPLSNDQREKLDAALGQENPQQGILEIQKVLDSLCLIGVHINPESRVKAQAGAASKELVEQGWRIFLIKVHNEAGVTAPLRCTSPNAEKLHDARSSKKEPPITITTSDVRNRFLDIDLYDKQPLNERLSGLGLEYRVIELFSRDRGKREAKLLFDVGQGTQELGFRNEVNLLFDCVPSVKVILEVLDDNGAPTTAQFTIRDERDRIYPGGRGVSRQTFSFTTRFIARMVNQFCFQPASIMSVTRVGRNIECLNVRSKFFQPMNIQSDFVYNVGFI